MSDHPDDAVVKEVEEVPMTDVWQGTNLQELGEKPRENGQLEVGAGGLAWHHLGEGVAQLAEETVEIVVETVTEEQLKDLGQLVVGDDRVGASTVAVGFCHCWISVARLDLTSS